VGTVYNGGVSGESHTHSLESLYMPIATSLQSIALDVIEPLCPATERMFSPITLNVADRIRISMHKDGKHFHLEFYSITQDGRILGPSYNAAVRFVSKLVDTRRLSAEKWLVGATDINCLLISYHWENKNVIFNDAESKGIYTFVLTNFVVQTNRVRDREDIDGFKFIDSPHFPLARYQIQALKACINTSGFGLFMEQGTGKTAVVIARMCNEALAKQGGIYRALIMVPKAVQQNWKHEIEKFASCKGVVEIIKGTQIDRIKRIISGMRRARLDEGSHFFAGIISMDSVGNSEQALNMVPWDLAVIDESHGIKNAETKRWKAMAKLRDNCSARMVLTGTPITNSMFDLWTQFEFMGEGWSGFTSFKKFRGFYGNYENVSQQNQHGYQKLVGLTNVPMIQERLARQAFLIRKTEALPNLPNKVYDIYEVDMTKEQETCYRQLCTNLMAEFDDMLSKNEGKKDVLIVNNILTQMLRLAQVTSGFVGIPAVVDEEGNVVQEAKVNRFDPSPKIEAVVEILKEKEPQQKTLIWTNWVQNIKTLKARLDIEGINAVTYYGGTSDVNRQKAVTAFNNDPNCKVLIGNPRAGGVGLNLLGYEIGKEAKTYCDHVIYFAQGWSLTDRAQSEDRPTP
jgi:superfamily II DNA or RNA helicase